MDDERFQPVWKFAAACILSILTVAGALVLWWQVKVHSMGLMTEASLFPMPLLIGVAVGWVARRTCRDGNPWTPILVSFLTLCAGLAGMALQEYIDVAPPPPNGFGCLR